MKALKILSVLPVVFFVALLDGCDTVQQSGESLSMSTPTRIVFDTSDTLYTGGLGQAGIDGFCKRIRHYLTKDQIGGLYTVDEKFPDEYRHVTSASFTSKQARQAASNLTTPREMDKKKAEMEAKTLKWHQELALQGDPYGEYQMGLHYEKGDGVPKDIDKAKDYLKKASDQGHEEAGKELKKLSNAT